jgi:molybdenum cofactor cytidylyltransferase
VEAICGAGCGEVLVVTGYMSDHVVAALRDLPVQFVHAEDYALGMGHSLAAGVRAAQKISGGFLITVGDLPRLSAVPVREVLAHFVSGDGRYHVVPTWRGQRGHPVVLGSWIRSGLESLTGDIGARSLLQTPEERQRIHFMETEDEAVVKDFDE